jgi:hypothetical protein
MESKLRINANENLTQSRKDAKVKRVSVHLADGQTRQSGMGVDHDKHRIAAETGSVALAGRAPF